MKAKTPEGMGTENAAIAHVAVLLIETLKPKTTPQSGRKAPGTKRSRRR